MSSCDRGHAILRIRLGSWGFNPKDLMRTFSGRHGLQLSVAVSKTLASQQVRCIDAQGQFNHSFYSIRQGREISRASWKARIDTRRFKSTRWSKCVLILAGRSADPDSSLRLPHCFRRPLEETFGLASQPTQVQMFNRSHSDQPGEAQSSLMFTHVGQGHQELINVQFGGRDSLSM